METVDFTRFILAFLLVIGLIGLLALFLKRYGRTAKTIFGVKEGDGRLQLIEMRYLDPKHKLALVKRDNVEHLLLLGEGHSVVVEMGLEKNE